MTTTMTPITRILTASMLALALVLSLPLTAQEASQETQETERVTPHLLRVLLIEESSDLLRVRERESPLRVHGRFA